MTNPISQSLSAVTEYEGPFKDQPAFVATIRVLIPHTDKFGTPVTSESLAMEYVSETMSNTPAGRLFLDWGYVSGPEPIIVCDPYVEGSFTEKEH